MIERDIPAEADPDLVVWNPRRLAYMEGAKTARALAGVDIDVSELNRLVVRKELDTLKKYDPEEIPDMGVSVEPNSYKIWKAKTISTNLRDILETDSEKMTDVEAMEAARGLSFCTVYMMMWQMNDALETGDFEGFEMLGLALEKRGLEYSPEDSEKVKRGLRRLSDKYNFYRSFSLLMDEGAFRGVGPKDIFGIRKRAAERYLETGRGSINPIERHFTLLSSIREATLHYGGLLKR